MSQESPGPDPTPATPTPPAAPASAASAPPPAPTGGTDLDAQLEAEIEAALSDMSIDDMLDMGDGPATASGVRPNRTGLIVAIHDRDVMVEFGPKSQGICPLNQFESPPKVGDRVEFNVERFDQNEGLLILSRTGVIAKANWDSLAVGQIVEARCTGMVKGGLEMEVASHKAFMPAGQVDVHFVKDISVFLSEKMNCQVITLDRKRGRIVLSRAKVIEQERAERRKELMTTLEVGTTLTATVTTVQPYGAFADIGGMDGLIHISDMSFERIKDPSEVVKEGDQVQVQILKIDNTQQPPRIGLGMKQCLADPFESKMEELSEGDTISGKVTRIMPFGAFIEITPGVEGLVHISQLAYERVHKVEHIVKPDEIVNAKVLTIDSKSRRIALSIKALKEAPKGHSGHGQGDDDVRDEDPAMRKLRAQLSSKFGDNLKGGIG